MRSIKEALFESSDTQPITQLLRSAIPFVVCLSLVIGASSAIYYVQSSLSEIEEALPVTLSNQERDIRLLVQDMGTLMQNIEFVRTEFTPLRFRRIVTQTDSLSLSLEAARTSYRFNDLLGISVIHATLNPAIYDIKNWLANGIYNFDARSAQTMELVEQRARGAYDQATGQLENVSKTAVKVLGAQAQRIQTFRNILIAHDLGLSVAWVASAKECGRAQQKRRTDTFSS